jgi:uncharacterized membrane-anchored protein YjiN (DUF445 family)
VARWAAAELSPSTTVDLVGWLRRVILTRPVAPLVATTLEIARRNGWDQRVIGTVTGALVDTLARPDFRKAAGDLVGEVLASYRERMGAYPRFLFGVADAFGLIDRDRVVSALLAALTKMAEDPSDPLRQRLTEAVAALPDRLRHDAALAARVEAAKDELIASPGMAGVIEDAAEGFRRALVEDLASAQSEVVIWIAARLDRARQRLATDDHLRQDIDRWVKLRAIEAIERYHDRIARFIERGVRALGPEGAVRLIEEHAGDDLQYIRINGTVVGGLAGGALYALHLLLRLF